MTAKVTVVDYKTSNIKSVGNMLRKIGTKAVITSDPEQVRKAEKLILPGIGAFDTAMNNLASEHLVEALNEAVLERGAPILGICLGMQLFAQHSEEGKAPGLGWIPGIVRRFDFSAPAATNGVYPIPHMGWNYVQSSTNVHPLLDGIPDPMRFYFVHSYHFVSQSSDYAVGMTNYGYTFESVVAKDNIMGVQFHPEKSHKYGMALLGNFVEHI